EITINKGNIGGFAKLQENIPLGYSAVAGITDNASYTFTDKKVKFVWIAIPADQSFSVYYSMKAGQGIKKGETTVDGVFSYIENDETKKCIIAPSQFIPPALVAVAD